MEPTVPSYEAPRTRITDSLLGRSPPIVAIAATLVLALGIACGDDPVDPNGNSEVASVQISLNVDTLRAIGATLHLVVTAEDAGGHTVTGVTLTWSSSDGNVATVSSSGVVTAVGNGTCTITVASGGLTATGTLVVHQSVSAVSVTPTPTALLPTETLQLTASVSDANNHSISGATVTWQALNAGVAEVDADGLVTAIAPGTVTITATVESVSGTATVTALSESLALMRDLLSDEFAQALIDELTATSTDIRTVLEEAALAMAEGDNTALQASLANARSLVGAGGASEEAMLAVLDLFLHYAEILLPQPISELCKDPDCSARHSANEDEERNR